MNEKGNSHPSIYLEVATRLTSFVHYHKEMKAVIVSQNETRVHHFSETFVAASGREPTEEKIREHLLFKNKIPPLTVIIFYVMVGII